jgi:hypothetical protein
LVVVIDFGGGPADSISSRLTDHHCLFPDITYMYKYTHTHTQCLMYWPLLPLLHNLHAHMHKHTHTHTHTHTVPCTGSGGSGSSNDSSGNVVAPVLLPDHAKRAAGAEAGGADGWVGEYFLEGDGGREKGGWRGVKGGEGTLEGRYKKKEGETGRGVVMARLALDFVVVMLGQGCVCV